MKLIEAILDAKDKNKKYIEIDHGEYSGRTVVSLDKEANNYIGLRDLSDFMYADSDAWEVIE